jgi:hypothetical protein
MFANILSIFPSFHVLTDEKKFLYLFKCEEYDIVEIIVRGVNEIYNRRNELIDKYFFLKISVKDIFVYCLKNDGNSLHNVTVS